MPEYVRDRDGDVWRVDGEELAFHRYESGLSGLGKQREPRWYVSDEYGPLVHCAEDGTLLPAKVVPHDVRALVAGALLDFADRMSSYYGDGTDADYLHDEIRNAARETAQAVLRGDVQPAEVSE